jgi:hypothetical protein
MRCLKSGSIKIMIKKEAPVFLWTFREEAAGSPQAGE